MERSRDGVDPSWVQARTLSRTVDWSFGKCTGVERSMSGVGGPADGRGVGGGRWDLPVVFPRRDPGAVPWDTTLADGQEGIRTGSGFRHRQFTIFLSVYTF